MNNNIDYRATLLDQFEALKPTAMFQRMYATVEDSPWHREQSVGVHTQMVVDEYVKMTDTACALEQRAWNKQDYLGGMACVFHDTGKPSAQVEKFSEARGKYRSYGGHEILSARKWESYAAERAAMFSAEDIAFVSFTIEHHMPWALENQEKLEQMARTANFWGAETISRAFLADQSGRLSDAKEVNYAACVTWMDKFMKIVEDIRNEPDWLDRSDEAWKPTLYMPIAPSGAGKSTYFKTLPKDTVTYSLDALRHEFYDADDYTKAYEGSVNDKSFEARATARFHALLKLGPRHLYIDNTNLSAKRRKFYLTAARKLGYKTVAVLMPVSLNVLLERQKTRTDKTVPDAAVKQQYKSLQVPLKGEFDEIVVSDHNLVKPNA